MNSDNDNRHQLLAKWLPTPGNIIFTLLVVFVLFWANSVGAIPFLSTDTDQSAIMNTSSSTIAYQGYLVDSVGNPVNEPVNITFRLYNVASGGTALWSETQTVTIADGLFSVLLGSQSPISRNLMAANNNLWLGLTVGTDQEMTPREKIASAPFAILSDVADGSITQNHLANNAVTGTKILDGSVTNGKLANNAVNASKIADGSISNSKLANNAVNASKIADGAVTSAKNATGYYHIHAGSDSGADNPFPLTTSVQTVFERTISLETQSVVMVRFMAQPDGIGSLEAPSKNVKVWITFNGVAAGGAVKTRTGILGMEAARIMGPGNVIVRVHAQIVDTGGDNGNLRWRMMNVTWWAANNAVVQGP
jgi:hypothetical protein